jgi:hypothetical protein
MPALRIAAVVALSMLAAAALPALAVEPVFPGKHWAKKQPEAAGLSTAALKAFSRYVGGRGCVTRFGYMLYTWGDAGRRADVASAAKVFYSHFLFAALERKRIPSLDEKVVRWEPRLKGINQALGYKDRSITWRHFANQTSCYQVAERPGEAFCYNDWQMALFWDTLFVRVYGATYGTVDRKVLGPLLTDVLGCEDRPTMMAFGTRDRAGRVAISCRDFCRFGLLYLRDGEWADKRVLSAESVRTATASPLAGRFPRAGRKAAEMIPGQRSIGSTSRPDNQCDHLGSYSFCWWTNGLDRDGKRHWPDAPEDTYGAFGHGGIRAMIVIPSRRIVLSWNAATTRGRRKENHALKLLMAAEETTRPAGQ